jgi:hypothetical protein
VPISDSEPEVQRLVPGDFRFQRCRTQPGLASSSGVTPLLRFPQGWERARPGSYEVDEEFVVLDGIVELKSERSNAGDHGWLPANSVRSGATTPIGSLPIAWLHGKPPGMLGGAATTITSGCACPRSRQIRTAQLGHRRGRRG